MKKTVLLFLIVHLSSMLFAQEQPLNFKIEFGGFVFLGHGIAKSKNTIDNSSLAHALINTKDFGYTNRSLQFQFISNHNPFFAGISLDNGMYGNDEYMTQQLVQKANPNFGIAVESKYGPDVIDDSPNTLHIKQKRVSLGYVFSNGKRFSFEPFIGPTYAVVIANNSKYAFKERQSNVYWIHEYDIKKLRCIGVNAGFNIKRYNSDQTAFIMIGFNFDHFQKRSKGIENTYSMDGVQTSSIEHPFFFKSTVISSIITVGVNFTK
ncbi:MAG: hypothetical protein RL204_1612 [Bacteroidota bacterium]|jgi:hypothetical protein